MWRWCVLNSVSLLQVVPGGGVVRIVDIAIYTLAQTDQKHRHRDFVRWTILVEDEDV
jgi:hypothetical protein